MTTKAELVTWLKSPSARRCILVEVVANVSGIEITRYLSNVGYVTSPTDTPQNTLYSPVISGGVTFAESVQLDSASGISFGDIEISNPSGIRDSWLDDVWSNRDVKVLIGDMSWSRLQFYQIFNGVVTTIDSAAEDKLNLKIGDKLQRINTKFTEDTLGGVSSNKDRLIPLVFGEVFNITPLLTNSATLEYQVHNGAIENIIEVRDDGVPVAFTPSLSTGGFTLTNAPFGVVTASVQGDKPAVYTNDIAGIIQKAVKDYGVIGSRLTDSDIDTASMVTFTAAHPQAVGIYLDSATNVLQVVQNLAGSLGAHVVMTRDGLLRVIQIAFPAVGTPVLVTASDMTFKSFRVVKRYDLQAGQKLGYSKNYTVQQSLLTGIPEGSKTLFSQSYQYASSTDSAVSTLYRTTTQPTAQDTQLLSSIDAQAECDRRLSLRNVQRTLYSFQGYSHLLTLEIGDAITITHKRFGFSLGRTGVVTKLSPDWMNGMVVVEATF